MRQGETQVRPCAMAEQVEALGVLYRRSDPVQRRVLVAEALDQARRGRADLSGLWIVRRSDRDRIIGALLTQALAGQVVAVWPPEVDLSWWQGRDRIAERLVREALTAMRRRGRLIAQALLPQGIDRRATADLERAGMPHVTDLIHLERSLDPPIALPDPGSTPRWRWTRHDQVDAATFQRTIRATYQDSLDMPELGDVRSLEDILDGHRASGRFDPRLWRIGRIPGPDEERAGAVLLLSAMPEQGHVEVTYLGLTPEARGRGLGRQALAEALRLARRLPGIDLISLAVDARNTPAIRLYEVTGFRPVDRRRVHLALLRQGAWGEDDAHATPDPDTSADFSSSAGA